MWEEQGITSVYRTLAGNKALSLHFQLIFFSYTSLVLAFSSVVVTDLGFKYVLSEVSIVVSLDTKMLTLNATEEV